MGLLEEIANPKMGNYLENLKTVEGIRDNQQRRRYNEIQAGIALENLQLKRQAVEQQRQGYQIIAQGLQPNTYTQPTTPTTTQANPPKPTYMMENAPPFEGAIQSSPEIQNKILKTVAQFPIDYIKRANNAGDLADKLALNPQMQEEAKMFYEIRDKAEEVARTQTKDQRNNAKEFTSIAGALFEGVGRLEEAGDIPAAEAEFNKQMQFLSQDPRLQNIPEAQNFIQSFQQYTPGIGKYLYLATETGTKARDQFQKEPRLISQKYGDTIESISMGLFDRPYKSLTLPERQQVLDYKKKTAKEISAVQGRGILPPHSQEKTDIIIAKTQEAFDKANTWTAGLGSILKWIPGTPAKDLSTVIDTIQANIGFDELNIMRQESKTGGALGQVTVRELELLQSTIASLDQAQSVPQLQQNILEIQDAYKRAKASYQLMQAVKYAKQGDIIDLPNGGQIEITELSPDGNHQYRRIK